MKRTIICATLALGIVSCSPTTRSVLKIDTSSPGAEVQNTMYGIFLEDINYGVDGGLYAEKVINRSFEFPSPLQGWKVYGKAQVLNDGPFDQNPHYVRISSTGHTDLFTGLENEGFFGIGCKQDESLVFSVWARNSGAENPVKLSVSICDPSNHDESQVLRGGQITIDGKEWRKYELQLDSVPATSKGVLRIMLEKDRKLGSRKAVDLEHVSLFPAKTFNGEGNGMREDIAQAIADLHPGVFRFPGGCIVEGYNLEDRYEWKKTLGPVENRPHKPNRWICAISNRLTPDYFQTFGTGFYEYFRFSEEIGAEPLPVLNCGMACQFQNRPDWNPHAPLNQLQPFVQDALDLIEFANGPEDSTWGKVRAQMGHPRPFNMKYIGIGNEQWGQEYIDRLEVFVKAIREKYPEIKIVCAAGPSPDGKMYDFLWAKLREMDVDLVDEHFYKNEEFFEKNASRYDDFPREGPKVFAGEYACHGADGHKFNHFNAALKEASVMTGYERNADVVHMTSYAPLLSNEDGWQWRPDLIWFNHQGVMKTCSYWVQWLYSNNTGNRSLPVSMDGKVPEGENGLYASCTVDDASGEYILKVVNDSDEAREIAFDFGGKTMGACSRTTLHADERYDENTLSEPDRISPLTSDADPSHESIGPRTFAVYRFSPVTR